MQSLSIQVSIGLILVLAASAWASEDQSQLAAAATSTAYSAEEWEEMYDKITNSYYGQTIEVKPMEPTETRDILQRLLIQVPEKFSEKEDWLQTDLSISRLDASNCSVNFLYWLSTFPRTNWIHMKTYLNHYIGEQEKLCVPLVAEDVRTRLGQVNFEDVEKLQRLGSFIPTRSVYDFSLQVKIEVVSGIVKYMKEELEKKKLSNLKGIFNYKSNFDNQFKKLVLDVCERVNSQVGESLREDFWKMEGLTLETAVFDGLEEKKELMELNSMCRSILREKEQIHDRAYIKLTNEYYDAKHIKRASS